jgi:hypothetical protein
LRQKIEIIFEEIGEKPVLKDFGRVGVRDLISKPLVLSNSRCPTLIMLIKY